MRENAKEPVMNPNIRIEDLPRCPVTGEIKPHRNAMGVSTYRVRVLTIKAVSKLNKGNN